MKNEIENRIQKNKLNETSHLPQFFRLTNISDEQNLNELLAKNKSVVVFDEIYCQLEELVKSMNPKVKFSKSDLTDAVNKQIGSTQIEKYGVWVFYPWSNRLVHLLDEKEFVDVRTSRNQNKITKEERAILAQKKIGVIGLSVGQSVSVTLTMERVCGEIRLADFDVLELTNLNRIRTGVHNLGLAKVYSVAREIAEIDPFLKVKCFPTGLLEANMDDFFLGDGKLDLLLEESDGFDIKILSRYKARELKIPVVMEASDRCTVDVERFDLEPERSILHGLVDHLDINTLKKLKTTEEKIPYMLDVLGIETSSLRLRASMLEIEQSINTWPQLASAVTMGGGIATDVSRRLLLNQFTDSGRYHLDIDELIGNKINKSKEEDKKNNDLSKIVLSFSELQKSALSLCIETSEYYSPAKSEIASIVDAANKAPSQSNMQAWKWYYVKSNLFLLHDISRSNSLLDINYHRSYISFGAAVENLILKAHDIGLNPNFIPFPSQNNSAIICQFTFSNKPINANQKEHDQLVTEIDTRLTNRTISERKIIDNETLEQLRQVATSVKGAQLIIVDSINDIEKLADIVAATERLKIMDERGHSDFVNETRWTNEDAVQKRDGIDLDTLNINATAKAGLVVAKNWDVVNLLKKWKKGSAFEKLPRAQVLSSSAMCSITMEGNSPLDYFNGGRAVQRTWLTATKMKISLQPFSTLNLIFSDFKKEDVSEFEHLKIEYKKLMNLGTNSNDILLFRLCIAPQPKTKTLRRKLEDVLIYE